MGWTMEESSTKGAQSTVALGASCDMGLGYTVIESMTVSEQPKEFSTRRETK